MVEPGWLVVNFPRFYPTCSRRLELWVAASMVNTNSIGDFEGVGTAALASYGLYYFVKFVPVSCWWNLDVELVETSEEY